MDKDMQHICVHAAMVFPGQVQANGDNEGTAFARMVEAVATSSVGDESPFSDVCADSSLARRHHPRQAS
jgi:hypothetical protein